MKVKILISKWFEMSGKTAREIGWLAFVLLYGRRAGATVYEGNWGPADDVLEPEQDVEMTDI